MVSTLDLLVAGVPLFMGSGKRRGQFACEQSVNRRVALRKLLYVFRNCKRDENEHATLVT